jgi:hypothetical protein
MRPIHHPEHPGGIEMTRLLARLFTLIIIFSMDSGRKSRLRRR